MNADEESRLDLANLVKQINSKDSRNQFYDLSLRLNALALKDLIISSDYGRIAAQVSADRTDLDWLLRTANRYLGRFGSVQVADKIVNYEPK